jgi:DNA repair protein RecN (Recombination protein N)
MLTQVHISNFITIAALQLDFVMGTSVITGETGVGKSIVIDAIELALGNRGSDTIIRQGADKAEVTLCFDISLLPQANAWLIQHDLVNTEGECILRRTIGRDGRSRSYINGTPSTLQAARELGEILITIHGQHEQQTLLKSDKQREIIDLYAAHDQLVNQVQTCANDIKTIRAKIIALQNAAETQNSRKEFLAFQLQELIDLNLAPNEFSTLELEHKKLANAGELIQNLHNVVDILTLEDKQGALSQLQLALQILESSQAMATQLSPWIENLKRAIIDIQDTEKELQHYLEHVELNPERLQVLDERISTLFSIARKHKILPTDLYEFQQKLTGELTAIDNSAATIAALKLQVDELSIQYEKVAQELSASRQKAAGKLNKEITSSIKNLGLPKAEFAVAFIPETKTAFSPHGLEKVTFQIKTNAGHALSPLAKIASGGELSRVSLAIYIATAEQHTIPTLIFDEVDVGISGGIAEMVGKLLRKLGSTHQVICVTHLPQVASQGHYHFKVGKNSAKNSTLTHIEPLTTTEKINEIARMLGGMAITKTTLAHAEEMLMNID